MADGPTLKRSISTPALVCYGVGTMVGGGFYALLGKVIGEAGFLAPVALLASGALALVCSFAFAELASRYPVSAGEARYVEEGFGDSPLVTLTGAMVIVTGVVSAATLTTATAGFLQELFPVARAIAMIAVAAGLGSVAAWGIGQSVAAVAVITVIEVGTLLFVIVGNLPHLSLDVAVRAEGSGSLPVLGVFSGAFLAFYAFIGFEDLVNVAEEVKRPRHSLPIAVLLSVAITTALYVAVGLVAVTTADLDTLATSRTPIAELIRIGGAGGSTVIVLVSLLAGVNGALVQIVMAARVVYGSPDASRCCSPRPGSCSSGRDEAHVRTPRWHPYCPG